MGVTIVLKRLFIMPRKIASTLLSKKLGFNSHFFDLFIISFNRAAGQGLLFLSTLYCAPFYGPQNFGIAGMIATIATMLSQFSSGRFEVLALSSRSASVRSVYFSLSYFFNFLVLCVGLVLGGAIYLTSNTSLTYALLIPVSSIMMSLNQFVVPAQQVADGEQRKIGTLAQITAVSTALFQVLGAWILPSAFFLVLSRAIGPAAGLIYGRKHLVWGANAVAHVKRPFRLRNIRVISKELFFGTPSALLSVAAFQIPLFFFNYISMHAQAGSYWLAFSLIFMPYLIIAATFRPLFLRRVVSQGDNLAAAQFVIRSTKIAIPISIGALAAVGLFAMIVTYFMPVAWRETETYCLWLLVLLAGLIIQTPITSASSAFRLQKVNFLYNVVQTLCRMTAVIGTYVAGGSPEIIVGIFSISGFAVCILFLPVNIHYINSFARR